MDKINLQPLKDALCAAQSQPSYLFTAFCLGFKFNVTYHKVLSQLMFEIGIFNDPNWPHSNWCYGRTIDEAVKNVTEQLNENLKTYPNGGKYTPEVIQHLYPKGSTYFHD